MKIAYVGDLIFGDQPVKFGYGCYHQNLKYDFFENVSEVFEMYDYCIANFEAVIKDINGEKNISTWSMVTTKEVVKKIKEAGINAVSVANNHTMDYGVEWFDNTVMELERVGVVVLGKKNELCKTIEINSTKVALVCFSDLKVKDNNVGYVLEPDSIDFKNIKEELNNADIRVVYCHWGSEFIKKPTEDQLTRLEGIIEYSFDAVIGHHAHIIQEYCLYKNTPVFFSLGNFISDYWQERARETAILVQEIDEKKRSSFSFIPCMINKFGLPNVIGKQEQIVLQCYANNKVTNEEINKERWRLRIEYLKEIIANFYKIKGKRFLLKWLFSRLIYIFVNFRKEKKDPNIIYEKYKI